MNIADKTIFNILAKSSEALMLLVSSVVFARYLSKFDYGTFLQVMLVVNTTMMLTFMGLPQSIYYYFHQVKDRNRFLWQNVLLSLFIGAVAAAGIYLLRNYLALWLNSELLAPYGWITALIIFFRAPSSLREPVLLSNGNLILNSFATLIVNLVVFGPAIVAAVMGKSVETILLVMLACSVLEMASYLGMMFKVSSGIRKISGISGHTAGKEEMSLWKQMVYSLPIGMSSYIGILNRQIDQYIISAFFTPDDFALYSRGAMRIPILSTIQFTVNNIMMPRYVEAYKNGDSKMFLHYFHLCIEKVAKINIPVFAFMFAIAPSFIILLYTEEYAGAAWIFRVYLFLLVLNIAVYGIIPRASGKTACIMNATIISLVTNIILSLVLVRFIGTVGAAAASIGATVLSSWYYLAQSCKILDISFREIFPWKFLFRLFTVSTIAALPVYALEYTYHFSGINLMLMLGAEWLIFCGFCAALMMRQGLFYPEDLDLLNRWFRFDVKSLLGKIAFIRKG